MIRLLLRLYPASWRERYGDEFAAVLEERPLGPFDVADVILGALDARVHRFGRGVTSEQHKGISMTLRIGGVAALVGGPLWAAAMIGSSMTGGEGPVPWQAVLLLATALLLVAFVGLSAFGSRRHPILVWLAFLVPAVGALIAIVGLAGMALLGETRFVFEYSAWYVWAIGSLAMFGGSGLFALATWASRRLSRSGAALVGLSSLGILPLLGIGQIVPQPFDVALVIGAVSAFALGWAALGASAVRIDRLGGSTFKGAVL